MVMAFMRSESFDWMAFGATEAEAKQAVVCGWNEFFDDNADLGSIEYLIECVNVANGLCFVSEKDYPNLQTLRKNAVRRLSEEQVRKLKVGDTVLLPIGDSFYESKVVQPLFWNSDADEPDWELETDNGYTDMYSVYVKG